jgi:N-formylglutamate amidohydrolase
MSEYFRIRRPPKQTLPIVVDVPHAGEWVPPEVLGEMTAETAVLKRDLDLYVDQIWQDAPQAGAVLIASDVSRYVIDLNRAGDDVTEKSVQGRSRIEKPGYYQDRGVVWAHTTDGVAVLREPMDSAAFEARIARFYTPYHAAIHKEIERVRNLFGYCILVDGHSMPSRGRSQHRDPGHRRSDIVPGDIDGRSCASSVTRTIEKHFLARGYTVSTNKPYKGGWITRSNGHPDQGVHAIQIEINRDLYMDEVNFEIKRDGMERLRIASAELLTELASLPLV